MEQNKAAGTKLGWADLVLVGAVTIWGVNTIAVKLAYTQFSAVPFMALRFVLPVILFAAIMLFFDRSFVMSRRDWAWIAVAGLVGTTLYQPFYLFGVEYSDATDASLIIATTPAFVAFLSQMLGRTRLPARGWLGVAVAFAGVVISVSGNRTFGFEGTMWLGYGLVFFSNFVWAGYILIAEPLMQRHPPVRVTALSTIVGSIPLVLVCSPALATQDWAVVNWSGWASLLFSSVLGVVATLLLWNLGVQKLGATHAAIYQNLKPAVAMLAAAVLLADHITPAKVIGTVIILLGVQVVRSAKQTTGREREETRAPSGGQAVVKVQ